VLLVRLLLLGLLLIGCMIIELLLIELLLIRHVLLLGRSRRITELFVGLLLGRMIGRPLPLRLDHRRACCLGVLLVDGDIVERRVLTVHRARRHTQRDGSDAAAEHRSEHAELQPPREREPARARHVQHHLKHHGRAHANVDSHRGLWSLVRPN
jgi:hypothetical protein